MNNISDIYNEYAYGCSVVRDACISYHGALQYYALQTQQFNVVYLDSPRPFRPFAANGVRYEYHPVKARINPLKTEDPEGNPIVVTSLSQTIVDCIRNIDLGGGLEEVLNALSGIGPGQLNEKEMLEYLRLCDNTSLWSRVGYLLSLFGDNGIVSQSFIVECNRRAQKVRNKLIPDIPDMEYNHIWKMFVPKNILGIINEGHAEDEAF